MRSVIKKFNWKENCFICGQLYFKNNKHPERNDCVLVATLPIRDTILNVCSQQKDKWAEEMRMRALDCPDCVAAEARYHLTCHIDFTTERGHR